MQSQIDLSGEGEEQKPPLFSSWRMVYIAILIYLVVLIAMLYAFSQSFKY